MLAHAQGGHKDEMALQITGGSSCPLLLLLLSLTSGASAVDLTLQRDAAGSDVVRSVLARLSELDSSYGTTTIAVDRQVIEQFIREMAYVETLDGEDSSEGGIWGVSRELFQQTKQYNNPRLFSTISSISCIDWASVSYDDLRTPLHSGLAIRIHLFSLYNPFYQRLQATTTDEGKARYWMLHFSGTSTQHWVTRTQQLRRSEGRESTIEYAGERLAIRQFFSRGNMHTIVVCLFSSVQCGY